MSRVEKTARAAEHHGRRRVVLGGGVAANRTLAQALRARVQRLGAEVYAPSVRLATDNAAMIARAGLFHFERGEREHAVQSAIASDFQPIMGSTLFIGCIVVIVNLIFRPTGI